MYLSIYLWLSHRYSEHLFVFSCTVHRAHQCPLIHFFSPIVQSYVSIKNSSQPLTLLSPTLGQQQPLVQQQLRLEQLTASQQLPNLQLARLLAPQEPAARMRIFSSTRISGIKNSYILFYKLLDHPIISKRRLKLIFNSYLYIHLYAIIHNVLL